MILELDIGNTRVKWRLRAQDGTIGRRGACTLEALLSGAGQVPLAGVGRLHGACVRGAESEAHVESWARAAGVPEVRFARAQAVVAGVTVAYAEPAQLGVDRWLCLLAAFDDAPGAACVVQCGSAITVDLLDADGRHHGGLIAPGLGLMRQSLLAGTDRVRFPPDALDALDLGPGRDTAGCVRAGITVAAVGLIERAVLHYRGICPGARVLLTGGDAPRIAPLLGFAGEACPELVLDGLGLALA